MKLLFSVILLVFTVSAQAQLEQRSVLGMGGSSSGIEAGEQQYYVSASIGQQGIIGTISNGEFTMRQGFQQPPIRVLSASGAESPLEARVYPNPVDAVVTVTFGTPVTGTIYSTLFDIQGRTIDHVITAPTQSYEVDMSSLAAGTYLLEVAVGTTIFTTRLIKN